MTETVPQLPPEFVERANLITKLTRMIGSAWVSPAIHAAAALGIPDALAAGPRRSEDLATAVGAHPAALQRLMCALVALELCAVADHGAFELTPLGTYLCSGTRESLHPVALLSGSSRALRMWGQLVDCVRTGDAAPKLLEGIEDPFDYLATHPSEAAIFDKAMVAFTRQIAGALVLSYDFVGIGTIVDVAGGYGALLPAILAAHPTMRGVVFDLPHCRDGALRLFEKTRLVGRCEFVAGSVFDAIPAGGDAYVMKNILHGLNDERSLVALRNCRAAMHTGARLLVIEVIVPDEPGASPFELMVAGTDLNMLVNAGGKERTGAEYRSLLEAAHFHLARVVPTPVGLSVIEALPQ